MAGNNRKKNSHPEPDSSLPEGDVLIRRVAGPDGIHTALGQVKRGRLYTVDLPLALKLTDGPTPEFEPAFESDRAKIAQAQERPIDATS